MKLLVVLSQDASAIPANAPQLLYCNCVSEPPADADTDTSPLHRSELPLTVLIFVPDTSVACLASNAVCNQDVLAIDNAPSAIAVALPTEVTGQVRLAFVVTVAAFPVILPVIALVTVMSVAQSLVNLAPVAPIVCPDVWSRFTLVSSAVCKSVCAERVPVILPQVHPPQKSDTNTFFKLPLSLVSEMRT